MFNINALNIMATWLITGSSRGIGLELIKQLLHLPSSQISTIFAVNRGPSEALNNLISRSAGRVISIVIPDITKEDSVAKGVAEVEKHLKGKGLDVLVNNAGIMPRSPGGVQTMPGEQLLDVLNNNVVSAHVVTRMFLPLLEKGEGRKIVNISSAVGSITHAKTFTWSLGHAYKISKAAMNMLTAQYAVALEEKGFTVIAISPGWLKTEMGSQSAHLEVSAGVGSVKEVILGADTSKNGKFLNIKVEGWEDGEEGVRYDGGEIAW